MGKVDKTLEKIVRGDADANINFGDLLVLLRRLGFSERVRGDHHIFSRAGVAEILNLQPRGSKAKAYQVKQVRGVISGYGLAPGQESEEISADDAAQAEEEKDAT